MQLDHHGIMSLELCEGFEASAKIVCNSSPTSGFATVSVIRSDTNDSGVPFKSLRCNLFWALLKISANETMTTFRRVLVIGIILYKFGYCI